PGRPRVRPVTVVARPGRGRTRTAGPGRRDRGSGPAARHGGAGRGRPGDPARAAVERHAVRAAGGGAHRRTWRTGRVGPADRERPDGFVHGDQAALAGRARTGRRRADRARPAPARLADLAADRLERRGGVGGGGGGAGGGGGGWG